jgi:tRNA pseudouridine55 synthase
MELTGILPLIKPKGITSFDCVFRLRKMLKTKKIGHTGTLDPDVTGVLPICIGRATKIAEYMSDYPKSYVGEVTIGYSTTTEDSSGELVQKKLVTENITEQQIKQVLAQFTGAIKQIPPMYSAVKVNGRKLYEYARANQTVERPVREVTIYELEMTDLPKRNDNGTISFSFRVDCSKGTYIRTLAVDIGKTLGYPAHMSYLQRVKSGPFSLDDCLSFEQIEQILTEGSFHKHLLPIDSGIAHFPKLQIPEGLEGKVRNGAVLPMIEGLEEKKFSLYNDEGKCVAIYIAHPTKPGLMKPEKMLLIE